MDQEKNTSVDNTSVDNTSVDNTSVDNILKDMIQTSLVYTQGTVDELKKAGDLKEELGEKGYNVYVHQLDNRVAFLLDITHRAFPYVFDLFPENHDNLNNCYILYKRMEKAGKLKECSCQFCEDNPVDPKHLEGIKTPEEAKEEKSASESDNSVDDTSSSQEEKDGTEIKES